MVERAGKQSVGPIMSVQLWFARYIAVSCQWERDVSSLSDGLPVFLSKYAVAVKARCLYPFEN